MSGIALGARGRGLERGTRVTRRAGVQRVALGCVALAISHVHVFIACAFVYRMRCLTCFCGARLHAGARLPPLVGASLLCQGRWAAQQHEHSGAHTRVLSSGSVGRTHGGVIGPRRATSAILQHAASSALLAPSPAPAHPLSAGPRRVPSGGAAGALPPKEDMQAVLAALAKENSSVSAREGGPGEREHAPPSSASGARAGGDGGGVRPFPRLPSAKRKVLAAAADEDALAPIMGTPLVSLGSGGGGGGGASHAAAKVAVSATGRGEERDLAARLRVLDEQKQALLLNLLDQIEVVHDICCPPL